MLNVEEGYTLDIGTIESLPGGGGALEYKCCTHARPEKHEKRLFFETERDSRESRLGVKKYLFSTKRVLFDPIRVCLGVIFRHLYSTKRVPPKNLV